MEVTCWNCSNQLKVDSVDYNEVLECPHCEKNFTIRKTKMDRLFFWQIPDSYGNGYERITSIPIDQYISEIFEHKRLAMPEATKTRLDTLRRKTTTAKEILQERRIE